MAERSLKLLLPNTLKTMETLVYLGVRVKLSRTDVLGPHTRCDTMGKYIQKQVQLDLINEVEPSSGFILTGEYLARYRTVISNQSGGESSITFHRLKRVLGSSLRSGKHKKAFVLQRLYNNIVNDYRNEIKVKRGLIKPLEGI